MVNTIANSFSLWKFLISQHYSIINLYKKRCVQGIHSTCTSQPTVL